MAVIPACHETDWPPGFVASVEDRGTLVKIFQAFLQLQVIMECCLGDRLAAGCVGQ